MLKVYRINGLKFRYEEGTQPEGAELVEASVKTKVVTPEVKIILPEDVETKKPRKSTKKG